jgi:hypothetical protein
MIRRMRARLALFALLVAGCSAKLSGDVTVDGKPFKPTSCRSGQVYGFTGVELTAEDGTRLRVGTQPSGAANVYLMPPGTDRGIELEGCGTLAVTPQNSTINDIRNVEGTAKLACDVDGHSLKGEISFSNCH